jgi:hypothetical protein
MEESKTILVMPGKITGDVVESQSSPTCSSWKKPKIDRKPKPAGFSVALYGKEVLSMKV